MANEMKQKLNKYTKTINKMVGILVLVVIGGAILLSTDTGRNLTGIQFNPLKNFAKGEKFRKHANRSKVVPNSYIVVLDEDERDVPGKAIGFANKHRGNNKHVYESAIKGFSTEMTEADAMALAQEPGVDYVEENIVMELQEIQTNAPWGISRIDNKNGYVHPKDTNYEYNATGLGVTAYVIDTGILTSHPDFEGRAVKGVNTSSDPKPIANGCNTHGTGVAGVIGSKTYGVAKRVKLVDVQVQGCDTGGFATSSTIIAGIDWIMRNAQKPAVANISMGGAGTHDGLDASVQSLVRFGIPVSIAAGNHNIDACGSSPARVSEALTVGGMGDNDARMEISNYGRCVDFFAPHTARSTSLLSSDGTYTFDFSGTSFAAPHAAGVAALYLEKSPGATSAQVNNAIISNATPGLIYNLHSGDPNLLLYTLLNISSTPPPPTNTPPPTTGDTTPPTLTLKPAVDTVLRKGNLKFSATASDPSGIAQIAITIDDVTVKTCIGITTCSMSISANSLTTGSHRLNVTATDKAAVPNYTNKSITLTK